MSEPAPSTSTEVVKAASAPATPVRVRRPWWSAFTPAPVIDTTIMDLRDSSLVASAARITSTKIMGGSQRRTEAWMGEAWTMFDLVGELHFLATTLARRASRARFYVGRVSGSDVIEIIPEASEGTEEPDKDAKALTKTDKKVRAVFESLGDGFIGLQEIVERAFLNQYVVGTSYLVGATAEAWKGAPSKPVSSTPVDKLIWRCLSINEFKVVGKDFELSQSGSAATGEPKVKIPKASAYVISLWNPHPADSSVPDSPVRATLPVLRELVGLTQHVSAQIDSRLAGAGLLVMRSSASRAIKRALNIPEDDPRDIFTETLINAMVTPIADRDSASAVVPLVITIPDETTKPEFISFSTDLDASAASLREEAIRRTALSLDSPPELLLGQGSTSHWTAWLTQEEVVDSHIAPTLSLIARALTVWFLRPVLRTNGVSADEAEQYAIWYDTSDLTVKANMSADAQALFALGILSEETVRRAAGFDESDAPKKSDVKEQAIDAVFEMVKANPGLMNRPGLDVLVDQMVSLLSGQPKALSAAKPVAAPVETAGEGGAPAAPAAPATPVAAAGATAPPGAPRAPQTTVSTPGLPQTPRPAAADTEKFGVFDGE